MPLGNKSLFNSTMILKQHLKVHLPAVDAVQIQLVTNNPSYLTSDVQSLCVSLGL